jgi:hypothetical protein
MTFGMLRVGVTCTDWQPVVPPVPLVPPVPMSGTQRPRELQVAPSPQPSSAVHWALQTPLKQKVPS